MEIDIKKLPKVDLKDAECPKCGYQSISAKYCKCGEIRMLTNGKYIFTDWAGDKQNKELILRMCDKFGYEWLEKCLRGTEMILREDVQNADT